VGILFGDPTGIGPEITAKLAASGKLSEHCRPLLIGDARVLAAGQKIAGVAFATVVVDDPREARWDGPVPLFDLKNFDPAEIELGKVSAQAGRVVGETVRTAIGLLRDGSIDGLTYAPFNKTALHQGGFPDDLHMMMDFLAWDGPVGEMNVLNNLWTTRATSHIPLKDVSAHLNAENIVRAIRMAYQTLVRAGVNPPRVAVCALNPHAGEGGLCGREEIDVIAPAIALAAREGIRALGPFSADTIFMNALRGKYDAVVTMYHDQGQIALKLMGPVGVTVIGGLPYAITTAAHGTAHDIAGQGKADPEALERAVIIAARMARSDKEKR
jgi:4-hydroxythreonine-4-phosphate dehydrogenase